MEHQEFCDIKIVISSQPDMEHQEGCGIKFVISSHPDMEHLEGCDTKTVATQYGTLRGLRYEKCNLIATWSELMRWQSHTLHCFSFSMFSTQRALCGRALSSWKTKEFQWLQRRDDMRSKVSSACLRPVKSAIPNAYAGVNGRHPLAYVSPPLMKLIAYCLADTPLRPVAKNNCLLQLRSISVLFRRAVNCIYRSSVDVVARSRPAPWSIQHFVPWNRFHSPATTFLATPTASATLRCFARIPACL
ncbi:hypothetical protein TNCV_2535561 [Trichonephila clavipes]|nr:hypothetical protein TNCV_2535561 [Trichonephila clavipes]